MFGRSLLNFLLPQSAQNPQPGAAESPFQDMLCAKRSRNSSLYRDAQRAQGRRLRDSSRHTHDTFL